MAKTTASAPGTTRANIGRSSSRQIAPGPAPSCAASRNRSAGISCQPCRISRVASGRLKNTWASTTPWRP